MNIVGIYADSNRSCTVALIFKCSTQLQQICCKHTLDTATIKSYISERGLCHKLAHVGKHLMSLS